jgi:recombination protein RecT
MSTQEITVVNAGAIKALRENLHKMTDQFRFALPAHIPPERFIRVVLTAVQNNPKLLKCSHQSLFNACMKAAQDGLLPDGREGAIVPYGDDGPDQAQWLPMVYGIRKKVRNSGALSDWNCQVVQEGDAFDYQLGDSPYIHHKPAAKGGRTRPVLFAYSVAKFPDGSLSREVMNIDQIRDIQSKSKAKRGPWSDPIFFPEMCRKTVAKLHAKQLPMSTDLDRLLHRDDELYDLKAAKADRRDAKPPSSVAEMFDSFAAGADESDEPKKIEEAPPKEVPKAEAPKEAAEPEAKAAEPVEPTDAELAAYQAGTDARRRGVLRKALPGDLRTADKTREALAWTKGWDEAQ